MLKRTHLALGLALALYFLPHVKSKAVFFFVVIIAGIIPEIGTFLSPFIGDKATSGAQKSPFFGRIIRSYTFAIFFAILFALYIPVFALPFFVGYSFNLYINMFTPEGIYPFWPLKKKVTGKISPGGQFDNSLFYIFLALDAVFILRLFI